MHVLKYLTAIGNKLLCAKGMIRVNVKFLRLLPNFMNDGPRHPDI